MSLLTTLLDNNVPFDFNGSSVIVQPIHIRHLTDNHIPFTFKDGQVVLSQNVLPKNDVTMDTFMQTIIRCLTTSGKFMKIDVYGTTCGIENECKTNVRLQYNRYSFCTIKLHANKMMLFYNHGLTIISLKDSFEKLNGTLPQVIEGLILMIIAGFKNKITALSLTKFECRKLYTTLSGGNIQHCMSDVKFSVDYNNTMFDISKNNRTHLLTNDLNNTIKFIENL